MTITLPPRHEAQTAAQNERISRIVNVVKGAVQSVQVSGGQATAIIEDGLQVGAPEVEYRVVIAGDGTIEQWQERFTASGIATLESDGIANPHHLGDWFEHADSLTFQAVSEKPF